MKKLLALMSIMVACAWTAPSALAVQDVTADANFAGTEGSHFTGDFILTVPSGTNVDDGAANDGIAITTGTTNTGSIGFSGTSTVTGVIGSSASVVVRQVSGGINEQTVTFGNTVFATTTTLSGNGTLTFADNANLTSAVTTLTNNTGSLNFLGTSVISGQVGTSSAKVSTITAGITNETVTFSSDVFATTTRVMGTGTVSFAGDVTSAINFNANGNVRLASGSDIVGAVTTSVNNTGSLVFTGTSSITSTVGSVAGNDLAGVIIEGGTVTLNNNNTDYAVTTTRIGSNTLAGTNGTMKIGGNSTITGIAQVHGGGTFDASQYETTVTGDFVLNANSTLRTTVSTVSGSVTTAGRVIASGANAAEVHASSALDVNVTAAYVESGTVYMLVDGADGTGVTAAPGTVTDNSATLTFTPTAQAGDLVMTVTRANMASLATNANGSSVGQTLNGFSTGASGDIANVVANLDTLSTAQAYTDAINQLDPEVNGGVNQASFNSTGGALSTVNTRLDNARNGIVNGGGQNGISSGDEFSDAGIWTQGFGVYGDQDDKAGVRGYNASTWGVAVGTDWRMSEATRLGVSFAYSRSDVDTNGDASTTDIDGYQGTVYGSYEGEPWYLDAMFSFGWNNYEGSRNIVFASINRTAEQDYDGQQYSTKFTFGYPVQIAESWSLVPMASLLYSHLNVDGFTETGANSINLIVDDQSYDFLQQGLGAKIVTEFVDGNQQKWTPSLHALWLYDYIGDQAASTATFTGGGASFQTEGLEPEQSSYNVGVGITVYPNQSLSLSLGYDFEGREDYTGHSASGTLRYEF